MIFWDRSGDLGGNDANDGLDPDRPVLTWRRVLEISSEWAPIEPLVVIGDDIPSGADRSHRGRTAR